MMVAESILRVTVQILPVDERNGALDVGFGGHGAEKITPPGPCGESGGDQSGEIVVAPETARQCKTTAFRDDPERLRALLRAGSGLHRDLPRRPGRPHPPPSGPRRPPWPPAPAKRRARMFPARSNAACKPGSSHTEQSRCSIVVDLDEDRTRSERRAGRRLRQHQIRPRRPCLTGRGVR